MCEPLPDISFGDAELFASAKVRSSLRAVNDICAWRAGDVPARPADVFAFDDCVALFALSKGQAAIVPSVPLPIIRRFNLSERQLDSWTALIS
jgi:hypothetical protein